MSFENQQKQENNLIKKVSRQGKCASCGKYWNSFDCFDNLLSMIINAGYLKTKQEIEAAGIIREKFAGALMWNVFIAVGIQIEQGNVINVKKSKREWLKKIN